MGDVRGLILAAMVLLSACAGGDTRPGRDGDPGGAGGGSGGEGGGSGGGRDAPAEPGAVTCTMDTDCSTRHCADGVCCDIACDGPCQSCTQAGSEGVCRVVKSGMDLDHCAMVCGPAGKCQQANGKPCTGVMECVSNFCKDGVCCDTACTAACMTCGTGTCTAVKDADDAPECATTQHCDAAGACKKDDGQTCTLPADCKSGFCADGVCCNSDCTGLCRSCNLAGTVGACTLVAAGMDPQSECQPCNASTCMRGSGNCDGAGACETAASCGVFRCTTAACYTTCLSNTYCCQAGAVRSCAEGATYLTLACAMTSAAASTVSTNANFTFAGLCTLEVGSDRLATTSWSGYEYTHRFVATADQMVTFQLTRTVGTIDIDLFVFEAEDPACTGGCCTTVTGCRASAHATAGTDESVTIAAKAGKSYYVVVDATTLGAATFTIATTCL